MHVKARRLNSLEQPLTTEEFSKILTGRFADALCGQKAIAVGLSGGPDSMVLTRLLSLIKEAHGGPDIHALTVDHGLRPGSAQEAETVASFVKGWPGVTHTILRWGDKASSRIQEEARKARYKLMGDYCRGRGIQCLFLAHHQDDQAETVLFRLAKGSGLDGLSGMKPVQEHGGLVLLRPFLDIPKERLLETCESLRIDTVRDPSNESENFARVRLRKSAEALAEEGLTSKRLATTARRIERARIALESAADKAYIEIVLEKDTSRIVINSKEFTALVEETGLRCLLRAVKAFRPEEDYAPRMEKIEEVFDDLRSAESFRKRTLAGLVFSRDDAKGLIVIEAEKTGE